MNTAQKQQVTPQLRQWIVEQAEAGHGAQAVLKAMLASGWQEDVAVDALESTLRGHLEEQAVRQGLPPALPVPDPRPRRVAAVPRCGRPAGLRAAGDVPAAGGGVRRAAVGRGMRGADRAGQAAPGALADGGHPDRRRGSQRRPHQQRHVLPARRERTGAPHRGAHRPAGQLAGGKRRGTADPALRARDASTSRTTTISIPPSLARPPSCSAAGSGWARW